MGFFFSAIWALFLTHLIDWKPYCKNFLFLLSKDNRKEGSYFEICTGLIKLNLKANMFPYRLDVDKLKVIPYSKWISWVYYFLYVLGGFLHTSYGIYWFATAGRVKHLDIEKKRELTGQKITMVYFTGLGFLCMFLASFYNSRKTDMQNLLLWPLRMERSFVDEGKKGYVGITFLIITFASVTSLWSMPLIFFGSSVWKPCMPFLTPSYFANPAECPTWHGPGPTPGLLLLGNLLEGNLA